MVSYAIRHATCNLPVSVFLAGELCHRFGKDLRFKVVPTGYDPNQFIPSDKKPIVLTVIGADTEKRMIIKGADRFISLARIMPEIKFVLIGLSTTLIEKLQAPKNVVITDFLDEEEVKQWMSISKVYVQLSLREGLPNAVLEAMLCECAVLGINHSGLAEAVGEQGILLEQWECNQAKSEVNKLLHDTGLGPRARQRVVKFFSPEMRKTALTSLISQSYS